MADDTESLKTQLSRIKSPWIGDFKTHRETWDLLLDRNLPTSLQPELTGAQEGLDFETADLENAAFMHVDVLTMNLPGFDVHSYEEAIRSKQDARDILLWTAHTWEEMNFKGWWSTYTAEGQVRHGISASQLKWREHPEPDVEGEKARNETFKRRKNCFYLEDCDIYGVYTLGDDPITGPDIAFLEYEVPFIEASEKYSKGNSKMTLDGTSKVVWLGEGEATQDGRETSETINSKVRVIVRDARSLDHSNCPIEGCVYPARTISIYVCGMGEDLSESHMVESYDSPFRDCSIYVVGGRKSKIRNPDKRYRPLLLPLYAEAHWTNYLNTLLATIGRTDYADEYFYIDLSQTPEWVQLPEGGVNLVLDRPSAESGKIPAYPGPVARFPKTASPHIMELLKQSQQRLSSYLPNRFLTGNANTEASNATGTAFIQQAQAAGLPYNRLLNESDGTILRMFQNMYHAIQFWGVADTEGSPTRYYVATSGQETILSGGAAPGEVIWVDANKLSMDFDLLIRTKSETLAEENMRWMIMKDKKAAGAATEENLIKSAGFDDVEGQKRLLRADQIRADAEPLVRAMRNLRLVQRVSAVTGMDFTAIAQMAGMGQPGQGSSGGQTQPANSGSSQQPTTAPPAAVGRSVVANQPEGIGA